MSIRTAARSFARGTIRSCLTWRMLVAAGMLAFVGGIAAASHCAMPWFTCSDCSYEEPREKVARDEVRSLATEI